MQRLKVILAGIVFCGLGIAQTGTTTITIEQQLKLSKPSLPGNVLAVATDGVSIAPVSPAIPTLTQTVVFGAPGAPGCIATSTAGAYALPRAAKSVAVYRNGLRASTPGEFSFTASNLVTMATPIPGEIVLCDYIF